MKLLEKTQVLSKIKNFFTVKNNINLKYVPQTILRPSYVETVDGTEIKPRQPDIKTDEQIEVMKESCEIAANILSSVGNYIKPGITTDDIDTFVHEKCIISKAYPSTLGYKGFPKSVCTSVNEVVCHGVPNSQIIKDGDIINVDITVFHKGFHGDTSRMFLIGNVDDRSRELVAVAHSCTQAGIQVCRSGAKFSEIGEVIYEVAMKAGFNVIPYFCGHGIGEYFHGPPDIAHVPTDSVVDGIMMPGMTFTIEPIICDGKTDVEVLGDGWTVATRDRSKSAQYEHTVLITETGYEILTLENTKL